MKTITRQNMSDKKHYEFIDLLRCIAIAAVLLQHSATEFIDGNNGSAISIANVFRGLTRWNILLFVMISGLLLIPKNISIKQMWGKYIKRIAICFVVWSALYTVYNVIFEWNKTGILQIIKNSIGSLISGGSQRLWYLVMLIGLYAVIPLVSKLLNSISFSEKKYCIVLLYIVVSLLPTAMLFKSVSTVFEMNYNRLSSVFPGIYVFYLILGACYFEMKERAFKTRNFRTVIIYTLGLSGLVISGIIHYFIESMLDVSIAIYPFICFAIFLLADSVSERISIKVKGIIRKIADCSFGIYLIHTFVQYFLKETKIANLIFSLPTIVSIILYFFILFLISWGLTEIIRVFRLGRKIT